MTLAILNTLGKIPVLADMLYMKHSCLAICSLANSNIFMEMLFIPVALLPSRLDIISRSSFLVQGDIRNDSLQDLVKIERFKRIE